MQQAIKPHIAQYKKESVNDFVRLINEYPIIGVLNVEGLPAPQFQKMRASLRDRVVIRMAKRRIIKIAFENARDKKKGIEELEKYLVGMPALVFTKDSPFNLSKVLKRSKSTAPAKAGQTAPSDIIIHSGPTPFAPGPVIGELGSIGLKTGVEGGKVTIMREATVVKEGEKISPKVAGILTRLGITPMEIGLDLVAAYEDGLVFTKGVLSIDEEEYINNLKSAASSSFNLSVFIGYATKENIEVLIKKAFNDAKALAISKEIISDEFIKQAFSKAERQMLALKNIAKIETSGKKAEGQKAVEQKIEEKESTEKEKEERAAEERGEEAAEEKIGAEKEGNAEEEPMLLKDIKEGEVEVKEKITDNMMKETEELVKRLQKKDIT